MRRVTYAASMAVLSLTACGTFQLASSIIPPDNKNADQQQVDLLTCKDQAKNEANTAGRQTGAFLLGMTIVGVPAAYEIEKSKQREVFAECMTARGYKITPADDGAKTTAANAAPAVQAPVQTKLGMTMPAGWAQVPLAIKNNETVMQALNRTIDAGAFLGTTKREGITDVMTYASTRRANQINRLTDAVASDITSVVVNGKKAYRFTVAGSVKSGTKITYLVTVIEGDAEIAIVNVWTSTANFDGRREAMELLSSNVTGL